MTTSSQLSAEADKAPWRLRSARLLIRASLSLIAISLVVVPIPVALRLHENGLEVGPQSGTPPAVVSPRDAARWRSVGTGLPADAAPVVLAYHDIRPYRSISDNDSRLVQAGGVYNVTPDHFDQQLTMLHEAGYRSVTAAEYIAYLNGGAVPFRSVLITFDGATQGLWKFADHILARHHMHGVAFLNPRILETHWTRYLSWPEIERMQIAGRWEFESAISHATLTARSGAVSSHVAAALQESTEAFLGHRLPVPRLLTWPIPVLSPAPRLPGQIDAAQVVQAPFVAAFANGENLAPPTSRRAAAGKLIGRIEVARTTDPDKLLATVESLTAIRVSGVEPLADPSRWTTAVGDTSPVAVSGRTLRFTESGKYEEVTYAADSSADWDNYAVDATVQNLKKSVADNASILVRVGSDLVLTVRVSAHSASVIETRGSGEAIVRHSRLFPSTAHHLRIVVRSNLTRITIDHLVTFAVRDALGVPSAGGIGLAGFRTSVRSSWPVFSGLTVVPATAASTRPDGVTPISVQARSSLAASSLWVRSRFAPASVLATEHALQFTGAKIRDFAEYAPAQTSQWIGYAFSATVKNLSAGDSVDLYGRLGSNSQALAIVGQHWMKVFSGARASRKLIVSHALPNNTSHRVSLRLLARRTLVDVDGITVASISAMRGTTGGIGVGATRIQAQAWPRLVGMTVVPVR